MKDYRTFLIIVLGIVLLFNGNQAVLAKSNGFSVKELSAERQEKILGRIHIFMSTIRPQKAAIECFDVNPDGRIAIGSSDSEEKTIGIYSAEGVFLYAYKFDTYGNFGLEWENDNIIIYFVRSDLAVTVNASGEVERILEIEDTTENNDYWNHVVWSTKKVVGSNQYVIKNDMGILNFIQSSYSQLIMIDSEGKETLIYDVNSEQLTKRIIYLTALFLFYSVGIIGVIRECKKQRKKFS